MGSVFFGPAGANERCLDLFFILLSHSRTTRADLSELAALGKPEIKHIVYWFSVN